MSELEDFYFGGEAEPAEAYVEPELPPDDADDATWDSYLDAFAEEPEQDPEEIDPLGYPQEGPPVGAVEEGVVGELRRQAWGEAFHDDLAGYVREAAAAPEFEIRDELAVQRVTAEILQARHDLFKSWLGQGATIAQATAALEDLDFESAIRVGLEGERYEQLANNSGSLGDWRRGRREAAVKRAMDGLPPQPDIMDSPSIARMRRQMEARAERQAAMQELRRAHGLGGTSVW